jgi:hypothetical protein
MNWAHAHLIVNHLPVIGVLLGFCLFLVAHLRKDEGARRGALVVLAVTAILAFPAYFSGTRAEDVVEHLPGVTEARIEAHEDAALAALVASGVLGLAALLGLAVSRRARPVPGWLVVAVLAVGLAAVALLGRAANLGGEIRHPEIRPGATPAAAAAGEAGRAPTAPAGAAARDND